MKKTVVIIQARMGSSRLPGKVLKKIIKKPMLEIMLERVKQASHVDQIIIATTYKPQDTPIARLARQNKVQVFRGKSNNVLDRFYTAATKYSAGIIVRLTADCPLIDPKVADLCIKKFKALKSYDYLSNRVPDNTYPSGMDVEIFSYKALRQAHLNASKAHDKEHVTPFIYQHPKKFKLYQIKTNLRLKQADLNLSVDTLKDFKLVKKILLHFHPKNPNFSYLDIVKFINQNPQLA